MVVVKTLNKHMKTLRSILLSAAITRATMAGFAKHGQGTWSRHGHLHTQSSGE